MPTYNFIKHLFGSHCYSTSFFHFINTHFTINATQTTWNEYYFIIYNYKMLNKIDEACVRAFEDMKFRKTDLRFIVYRIDEKEQIVAT